MSPGCKVSGGAAGDHGLRLDSQGNAGAVQDGDVAGGMEHVAALPCAGINDAASLRIEPHQRQGDEVEIARIDRQDAVGAGEDFADVAMGLSQGPQAGAGFRHQQGRAHAVAADVAHHDPQAAVAPWEM